MLTFEQVELFQVRLPRVSAYRTSYGDHTWRETVLARVVSNGIEGWGEFSGDGPGFSYETAQTAWHILKDYLIPLLCSTQLETPSMCPALFAGVRGHPFAKATLEAAVWDVAGKQTGTSLHALLQRLYPDQTLRTKAPVGVSIGLQPSIFALEARLQQLRSFHLPRIKLKVRPGWDDAAIKATRLAYPDTPLSVDGNSAYARGDIDRLVALDDLDLTMIEQPFGPDDLYSHRDLQARLQHTPVCLDESIHSVRTAESALRWHACRVINIKQGRVGGLTQAIELHNLCVEHHIPVYAGGMFETGIGKSLNAALACLPNFNFPGDAVPPEQLYGFDLIQNRLDYSDDGELSAPSGPGLGFTVDLKQIKARTQTSLIIRK